MSEESCSLNDIAAAIQEVRPWSLPIKLKFIQDVLAQFDRPYPDELEVVTKSGAREHFGNNREFCMNCGYTWGEFAFFNDEVWLSIQAGYALYAQRKYKGNDGQTS